MSPAQGARWELAPGCLVAPSDTTTFALPAGAESPLAFSGSARTIFELALDGYPYDDIVGTVSEVFGVDHETADGACRQFCEQLLEHRVVVEVSSEVRKPGVSWNILTVCSGNICRSLFAERFLSAELEKAGVAASVRSAGTTALHGRPVPAEIESALQHYGLSAAGHEPRQLTAADVTDADLILCATVDHRRQVLQVAPAAMKRTFTILEAAAAAQVIEEMGSGHQDPARALAAARTGVAAGSALDVEDPYQKAPEKYETMERTLSSALRDISRFLQTAADEK